jgi:hypothetical protein
MIFKIFAKFFIPGCFTYSLLTLPPSKKNVSLNFSSFYVLDYFIKKYFLSIYDRADHKILSSATIIFFIAIYP